MKRNAILLCFFVIAIVLTLTSTKVTAQWTNGPNGGGVRDLCEHNEEIFAISNYKMFKSNDNAQTWQEMDMSFLGWNRWCISLFSNEDYLFVNTADGLFRSSDAGMSWTLKRANVHRVAINESTLFVYSSLDNTVYRSQDNGDTWVQKHSSLIDNTPWYDIGEFSFNGDILFLGSVNYETALYRSGNLGETWEHITAGLVHPDYPQFYIGPKQALFTDSEILLATWLGVYKSADNGLTWAPALYDEEFGCEKLMKSGSLIIAKGYDHKYWRSFDGTIWDDITNNFPNNVINSILEQNNTKTTKEGLHIFSGIDGIYFTQDNFNTSQATDNTGLVAWPVEPSQIVACDNYVYATAGGRVFKTNDFGQNWTKTYGHNSDDFYEGLLRLRKSNNLIYGISGENLENFHFTTDFGETWQVIPNTNTNWMAELDGDIYRTTMDGIYKSVDNGTTWTKITTGTQGYYRIYATETTLFANNMGPSDRGIHKSTDFGQTWTNVGLGNAVYWNWEFLDVNGVLFIGVDYTDPRGVWRSLDNGDTWEHVSVGTKVRRLRTNGTKIYFSTYDPNNQKYPLFVSSNNGNSWQQVMDDCLNIFDVDNNYLYVNSFPDHVIRSSNDGATWENLSDGHFMFRPRINGINVLNQGLFVGTMKTGYYALSLLDPIATVSTLYADNISDNSASLYGAVNPNGSICNVVFEYGTSTDFGFTSNATPEAVSGNVLAFVNTQIEDLAANTTYYYRVVAKNSSGNHYGETKTFSTLSTGIESVTSNIIKTYPNPFKDDVFISNNLQYNRLVITNVVGHVIMEVAIDDFNRIDVKDVPKGLYLFWFSDDKGNSFLQRMIKM